MNRKKCDGMKNLKCLLEKERHKWKAWELIWLLFASAVILGLSLYWGDNWLGITSALTGVCCVILTGKGKRSSFIFGMVNVLCYIFIALKAKFYGEVMLNLLYYIPMNVVGWIFWTRNMNRDTGEVVKVRMSVKTSLLIYVGTLLAIGGYGILLKYMGGNLPFIDSMSTVVAIVAQILSVKRLAEQWVLWIVVDVVSVIMWGINFARGGEDMATLLMWAVYLANAVIMYIKWMKEAKK